MTQTRGIYNIPNFLTFVRLAVLPAVIILFRSRRYTLAGCVFVFVMVMDCIDGLIARRRGQCTRFGIYLDPVVDKIIILSLFYELAHAGVFSYVIAHLFLARELLQNSARGRLLLRRGGLWQRTGWVKQKPCCSRSWWHVDC